MKPKAALFDIGSTLWSSPSEDPGALAHCYGLGREILLRGSLDAPSIEILIETVEGHFAAWEDIWRADASQVLQRPTTEFVREALERIGLKPTEEALAGFTEAILDTSVYTAKVEPPEPEMPVAMAALKERGLRLGCVSNAFMPAAVLNRILDERGLGPYTDFTLSSCELGYRKPLLAIYEEALRQLSLDAHEVVFVGDRIDADIEGPAALGMRTVLTQQYRREDPAKGKVKPDYVISHLSELPAYIDSL
jgi:FMN phosphatase YigB (HAD superfamily)